MGTEINQKKHIYYDATFSIDKPRGMGKYVKNFITALEGIKHIKCIGLLPGSFKKNDFKNTYSFGFYSYILWEQISLLLFSRKKNDLVIFSYNTAPIFLKKNKNRVLFLYDLIFMGKFKTKSLRQRFGNLYRKIILPVVIKKFDQIITCSEYSKQQIIKRFKIKDDKITVIWAAIDLKNFDFDKNIDISNKKPYFLHIGGQPDHKNTISVIKSFSLLPPEYISKYKLYIVGINEINVLKSYKSIVASLNLNEKIIFLPYQKDEEIVQLFKYATLSIFPSKEEGFGIPIIESFKYGCPLLCSNVSCMPEIAQDAAHYFNPNSNIELTNGIIKIISNVEETNNKVVRGYEVVKLFSRENFNEKVSNWYNKKISSEEFK
tara:strand:- start:5588 stop:6715 length:1128 start_codon:yes stop_codon:yes gene_type:complete